MFIDGLRMNSAKIQVVVNWLTFINLKEIQAFIDFCNFYKRFIKNFSKIIKSMIYLTEKNVIFQ